MRKKKIVSPFVKLLRKIRLIRAYPLTTPLAQKIEDAMEFNGWTVFFNNAHNLAHVIHNDYPDGYFRLKCTQQGLKTQSDDQLLLYFVARLSKQLILD